MVGTLGDVKQSIVMIKRSLTLAGHRTSVALEAEFWNALDLLAAKRQMSLPNLLADIDANRGDKSLASAARITALESAQLGLISKPAATTS